MTLGVLPVVCVCVGWGGCVCVGGEGVRVSGCVCVGGGWGGGVRMSGGGCVCVGGEGVWVKCIW